MDTTNFECFFMFDSTSETDIISLTYGKYSSDVSLLDALLEERKCDHKETKELSDD